MGPASNSNKTDSYATVLKSHQSAPGSRTITATSLALADNLPRSIRLAQDCWMKLEELLRPQSREVCRQSTAPKVTIIYCTVTHPAYHPTSIPMASGAIYEQHLNLQRLQQSLSSYFF
ncbi:hypothetical protein CF327_g1804 [Tilletia walkeri]|uniref:Uncharacterized protein n=1 Tax=Tilletia walkeri TaxID=117179 RepID=A0A8X7NHJ0_9BASI|nr:hypothetical protein CF327_g1804 [Tilletia walkeri]KAE8272001.1 hypothetical protein A4X09_0g353 [Tilletia walkeri]